MTISSENFEVLMDVALAEAELAYLKGEVPVGAVISLDGKIISRAHNEIELRQDATAHAELIAIQEASASVGSWRLDKAILCVTLEPCPMCAAAIRLSRISTVVFGAKDPRMGAMGSLFDLSPHMPGESPRVVSEVKSESSQKLLQKFFEGLRQSKG